MATEHRYSLEKYSGQNSRYTCPGCQKTGCFSRYMDNQTGKHLDNKVGKCNRINECGYHFPPREYFSKNERNFNNTPNPKIQEKLKDQPIDYIPQEQFVKTLEGWKNTSFAKFLIRAFEYKLAKSVCNIYNLGQSNMDEKTAVIFWEVDFDGNVRTGKIMCYNEVTGKRKKDEQYRPRWVHNSKLLEQPFNMQQCFFGEHLLKQFPNKEVMIVEGASTAIIATLYMPQYIWLATGGVTGVKWLEYSVHKVLQNRNVTLFPDFGFYNKLKGISCYDKWKEIAGHLSNKIVCKIGVSKILENNLNEDLRIHGYDLADYLVKIDENGQAEDSDGLPIAVMAQINSWWDRYENR